MVALEVEVCQERGGEAGGEERAEREGCACQEKGERPISRRSPGIEANNRCRFAKRLPEKARNQDCLDRLWPAARRSSWRLWHRRRDSGHEGLSAMAALSRRQPLCTRKYRRWCARRSWPHSG